MCPAWAFQVVPIDTPVILRFDAFSGIPKRLYGGKIWRLLFYRLSAPLYVEVGNFLIGISRNRARREVMKERLDEMRELRRAMRLELIKAKVTAKEHREKLK